MSKPKPKPVFYEKVKAIRSHLGLSQEDFAEEMEVSTSLLAKIETGAANPSIAFKSKLLSRWNITPDFLDENYSGTMEDTSVIFTSMPELRSMTREVSDNPWKDEAFIHLKEEVKFYRSLIQNLTGGKTSFLPALKLSGLHPKRRHLSATA